MKNVSDKLMKAERQLRYYQRLVEKLREASDVCRTSDASDAKEREAEKENLSPTPPIREKGEEKETVSALSRARARAADPNAALSVEESRLLRNSGSCNQADRDLLTHYQTDVPTPARVKKHFALCHPKETDTSFIDEWYAEMDATAWINPKNDKPTHWCHLLEAWFKNMAVKKALRDPGRIPDARKARGGAGVKHLDNYLATRDEQEDTMLEILERR